MRYLIAWTLALPCAVNAQSGMNAFVAPADSDATDLEVVVADEGEVEDAPDFADRRRRLIWITSARYSLERRAGYRAYDSTAFRGPPVGVRSRLRVRAGRHVEVVAVVDHDEGEGLASFDRAFDFVSASIVISNLGPVNYVIVGAIQPRMGVGLALWNGRRLARLSMNPASFMHPRSSVGVSTSTYETSIFRGVGLDLTLVRKLRVVAFAAGTSSDAVLDGSGAVISLPTSGLHRNDREMLGDDRLKGSAFGGTVLFDSGSGVGGVSAGLSFAGGALSRPIAPGDRPYRVHRFTGRLWRAASFSLRATFGRKLVLSGEGAVDRDRTPAGVVIVRVKAARGLWIHASWRDYPDGFTAVFGSAPGASGSGGGNERGWLVGIEGRWAGHHVRVTRDLYKRPWLQYDSFRPSIFERWGIEVTGRFRNVRYTVRFDEKRTNRESMPSVVRAPPFERRRRIRVRLDEVSTGRLRPGIDLAFVGIRDTAVETGEALGQRLVWSTGRRIELTSGVVFFRSDSGDSGIYLFEPDLPDQFSVPLLSEAGFRAYALVSLRISTTLTCWIKGAVTRYDEERAIGSGADRIVARQLRSLSFALRYAL